MDYDLANAAMRVLSGALSVVPGDAVVLVVDEARRDVGAALFEVARAIGTRCDVVELEALGARPHRALPLDLAAKLRAAQVSVALFSPEDAEFGMRRELLELVREVGLRHAHMVGVTRKTMTSAFSVDPARILEATRAVRTRLKPDSTLHLKTAAGSDLIVKLGSTSLWTAHDGVIRPGRWENLPAGELTAAPERVDGVFVADASIGGQMGAAAGLLKNRPVTVEIEEGVCRNVACGDTALRREVAVFLAREAQLGRVGTVTLGTNVGMLEPSGEYICDQNLPGLHIAFGSVMPEITGATFRTRAQLTMTCAGANVDLDGAPLLRNGRYIIG
jgi:leucyl aminopeptidase (aminopeptidase T)